MLIWLEKVEHYKLKKLKKFLKAFIKMKRIIECVDIEIQKQKFHKQKETISIKIKILIK